MDISEALKIVADVFAQQQVNLGTHQRLQEVIKVLEQATRPEPDVKVNAPGEE